MQYENNLRIKLFYRKKNKTRFGFQRGTSGKRGSSYNQGRLIFGSIR